MAQQPLNFLPTPTWASGPHLTTLLWYRLLQLIDARTPRAERGDLLVLVAQASAPSKLSSRLEFALPTPTRAHGSHVTTLLCGTDCCS